MMTTFQKWAMLLFTLTMADVVLTLSVLHAFPQNSAEANPFMAYVLSHNPWLFVPLKLLGTLAVIVLYHYSTDKRVAMHGVRLSTCIYAVIVGINVAGLCLAILYA